MDSTGITLRIRKTDTASYPIARIGPERGAFGCIFDVRDSKGNPVPPRPRDPADPWIKGSGQAVVRGAQDSELKRGESVVDYAPIGQWFELAHPGIYTVQVSQHVSSDPNSAIVKSNKITITVVP